MNKNIKIFGIGLHKTGTTSFAVALRELGYTNGITWINNHLMDIYDRGDLEFFLSMSENYTFFHDIPWALLYKEFHQKYPDAYFILTTRKDPLTWYRSHCKHILVEHNASYSNNIIYKAHDPRLARKKFITYYNKHNNDVRNYFSGNPNFIEVCWETDNGWEKICNLLKKDIPEKDFPHSNRLYSKKKTLQERISSYFIKKKEIRINNPYPKVEFSRVEDIEVSGKTVVIRGVNMDENGYNHIRNQKLFLSDGRLSIEPNSVELINDSHFNEILPYKAKDEKIGFIVKFAFPYKVSDDCIFSICINDNSYKLSDFTT